MPESFERARALILDHVRPLATEEVPLLDALGRALVEPLTATRNLPLFDNSAMDGFAVRAQDCLSGEPLKIRGYIPAGGWPEGPLEPGFAVRIMTGAPIPAGADCVVPVEETREEEDLVWMRGAPKVHDHIRFAGEDMRRGEEVAAAGTVLRPAEISMLASFGMDRVRVHRRPKVAILSTGDELVELGQALPEDRIVNSNSWSLAAQVKELGADPVMLGIARDNLDSLKEKVAEGLAYDALITSAGVSAGDRDFVREALEQLGVTAVFWKVDIKPGRPTAFGIRGEVPVFSLPGNPVSTMMTFDQFVRPALLKMMGHRQLFKATHRAVLEQPAKKKPGRTQFMRVGLNVRDGRLYVSSAGDQNTGILKTMVRADAIAVLAADRDGYDAGEEVDVHLLRVPMSD